MTTKKAIVLTSPSATVRAKAAKRSAKLRIHYVHTRYARFSTHPRRH